MEFEYVLVDVFTQSQFKGNQLAVFPDATGLDTERMQKIAREFNFSETAFVFPAQDPEEPRVVRIFTPTVEVPFAGHPNIGTAFVLSHLGLISSDGQVVFSEKAGRVAIEVQNRANGVWCELKAPEPLSVGQELPRELLAAALSLDTQDLDPKIHPPMVASVGLPFVLVRLNSREALKNARANLPVFDEIHDTGVTPDIHLYVEQGEEIFARMFAPHDGVPEDPATGSANCALVAFLSHLRPEAHGEFAWRIQQGVEMGRASMLEARTVKQDRSVTEVFIGGHCAIVAQGRFFVA